MKYYKNKEINLKSYKQLGCSDEKFKNDDLEKI